MKYGVFLPYLGHLAQRDALTCIKTTAQTAEALGFDSVASVHHHDKAQEYRDSG